MRVVVDTNVFISRFLSALGAPARLFELWRREAFQLLASEPILAEYRRVLGYPKIQARHRLTDAQLDETIAELRQLVVLVTPTEAIEVVAEDPSDNRFLECAVVGSADYIVSGDRHLLSLEQFRGIPILTPAEFLTLLQSISP